MKRQKKEKQRTRLRVKTGICLPGNQTVTAYITGTAPTQKGTLSVRWELWHGGVSVDTACTPKTHRYDPDVESWDRVVRLMASKAEDAFRQEKQPMEGPASQVCRPGGQILWAWDSLDEAERQLLRKPTWGDSTWRKYEPTLRKVCARLDALGPDLSPDAIAQMRQEMIRDAGESKHSKGPLKAAEYVDQILLAASYSLNALHEIVSQKEGVDTLPDVDLAAAVVPGTRITYEQAKWIEDRVLVRLVASLYNLVRNGLTMGVALMLTMGLRTSEACAAHLGELECHEDGVVIYKVRTQGADRTQVLKTANAYRDVFAGRCLWDLLKARWTYLSKTGYSEEEIAKMPAVSLPDNPCVAADSGKVSEFARKLLFACGYDSANYNKAARLMTIERDHEADGSVMQSTSAYILRRCYATLLCNNCDLAPGSGIEDYLLGHARQGGSSRDYQNPTLQHKLAGRLARVVLHPDHSAHPLYQPIPLRAKKEIHDLGEHVAYTFVAEDDVDVTITAETREPAGTLACHVTGGIQRRHVCRLPGTLDDEDLRANRPIVLMPILPDAFEEYLRDVDDIDLSDL